MKKILCFLALLTMFVVGSASAYGIYLNCSPTTIPVGQTIKCSIDSDFPPGTSFNLVFYQKQYTSTQINNQVMTIQPSQQTQYALFDTTGLKGGQYDVEIEWNGAVPAMRSDSVASQIIMLTDRSAELTLTSATTQNLADALVISGSHKNAGNSGIQIQIDGASSGRVFGPQYIQTVANLQTGDGIFTQTVPVTQPDDYTVKFSDENGLITSVVYHVISPTFTATIPTTITPPPITTTPMVTYTPIIHPTPTKSPLSVVVVIGALGIAMLVLNKIRNE
ncbi:MAG: hypothetical protein WCC86_03970 [Methanoregula sp.]|uniref:hypothetical protein n=1 Tax=Methanoregula sp. TaxID=2052170 RepID=UPI003BB01890